MASLPKSKKLKTGNDDVLFFKDFLFNEKNKELVSMLRAIVFTVKVGLENSSVVFLRVNAANANSCVSFSKAWIDVKVLRDSNSSPVIVPYALFFMTGLEILTDFVDKHPKIPGDLHQCQALRDLLQFLLDLNAKEHPDIFGNKGKGKTKCEQAVRFAHHLFLPLMQKKYFLINSFNSEVQSEKCCAMEHQVSGRIGDTSFGCLSGWHGRTDILLGDKVPFTIVEDQEDLMDSDVVSVTSDSSAATGDTFSAENIAKITAQTIAYSFVQHKKHPMSPYSFVPGIGICSEKLIVYLYDCIADILVATGPIDLCMNLGGIDLNTCAIIILWFTLNHDLFGNKTPHDFTAYTANFHHILGPTQLEAYRNVSCEPCEGRSNGEDLVKFWEQHSARFQVDVTDYFPGNKSKIELN